MLAVLKKYSILYVEDELEIQADMEEYLKSYFNKVYLASDGKEALKIYTEFQPSVLLLDINIPYIDGLTLAKKIRKTDKLTKIIMLTGLTDTPKLLVAIELNLTKYLVKPISPKVFKETLKLLASELTDSSIDCVCIGETSIWNVNKKSLMTDSKPVLLLEKELKLLELFIKKRTQRVSYEEIMVAVWEDSFNIEISIDSVKNQVSHLRKKLPKGTLLNIYGYGYKLI